MFFSHPWISKWFLAAQYQWLKLSGGAAGTPDTPNGYENLLVNLHVSSAVLTEFSTTNTISFVCLCFSESNNIYLL